MSTPNESNLDPMNMPIGQIDTSYPKLKPTGLVPLIIRSPEIIESTDDEGQTKKVLRYKVETTTPLPDTDDKLMNPGFKFTENLALTPTPKWTIADVAKSIAALLKCLFGANGPYKPIDLVNDPSIIADKPIDAKIKIQVDKKGEYGDSNRIVLAPPV